MIHNVVDEKTDVALGMEHNFQQGSDQITFGFRFKHSEGTTVKAQV